MKEFGIGITLTYTPLSRFLFQNLSLKSNFCHKFEEARIKLSSSWSNSPLNESIALDSKSFNFEISSLTSRSIIPKIS